jgi:DNA-binding response OmpR family regulator
VESELRGLELGAVDYICKPVVPPVVLARCWRRPRIEPLMRFCRF